MELDTMNATFQYVNTTQEATTVHNFELEATPANLLLDDAEVTALLSILNSTQNGNSTIEMATMIPPLSPVLPKAVKFLYLSFRVLWAILALCGNILTITAVAKYEVLQKSSNFFVCSLAMADIISALVVPLEIVHEVNNDSPYYTVWCFVDKTFNLFSMRGNFVSIFFIAVDRLMYIAYPFKYPLIFTRNVTFGIIAVAWVHMLIENPLIIIFGTKKDFGHHCKLVVFLKHKLLYSYLFPQYCVLLTLPLIIYCIIAVIAYKQKQKIITINLPYNSLEANVMRNQHKIAKMMFTVLAFYLSSNVVHYVGAMFLRYNVNTYTLVVERLTLIIFYLNTWVNPFIYCWRNKEFRTAFKKILHRHNHIFPKD